MVEESPLTFTIEISAARLRLALPLLRLLLWHPGTEISRQVVPAAPPVYLGRSWSGPAAARQRSLGSGPR